MLIGEKITNAYVARKKCEEAARDQLRISSHAWAVLAYVVSRTEQQVRRSDLSQALSLGENRVSEALGQLDSLGYITLACSVRDHRQVLLQATTKGENAVSFVRDITESCSEQEGQEWEALMAKAKHCGLSETSFRILLELKEGGSRTASKLSSKLCVPQSSINDAKKQLLNRGFIIKENADNDGRAGILAMKEAGFLCLQDIGIT